MKDDKKIHQRKAVFDFDRLKFIYNLLLVLFPVLGIYTTVVPSVNLGELLLMAAFPFLAVDALNKNVEINPYWNFLVYSLVSTFLVVMSEQTVDYMNVVFMVLRLFFHAALYVWLGYLYLDIKLLMKIYKVFVYAAVGLIFAQWIVFRLTGYLIPYLIPWFQLRWTIKSPAEVFAYRASHTPLRISAFFVEPADYAQFITPFYIYLLFKKEKKTRTEWIFVGLILLSVLIATSALFLISIVLVSLIWLVWKIKNHGVSSVGLILLSGAFVALLLYMAMSGDMENLEGLLDRLSEIDSSKGATSGNMRVLRGFAVFSKLDPINKIFGVGVGNTFSYSISHGIKTPYDYGTSENFINFMSSLSNILVWNGAVGFVIYLAVMIRQYIRSERVGKVLLLYLLILMLSASIYVVPTYPFMISLIIGFERGREQSEQEGEGMTIEQY